VTELASESAPLSVLHLVLSVAPAWDGLARQAVEIARAQHRLGQRASLWCLDTFPISAADARERFAEIDEVRVLRSTFPAMLGFSATMLREARGAAGAGHAVLHQHGIWHGFSIVVRRWHEAHRGPTVIAPGGTLAPQAIRYSYWRKRCALLAYERSNLRSASCLHAVSPLEASHLRAFGLSNPIAVIPAGVSDEWLDTVGDGRRFRQRLGIDEDRRVLLFLSRLHPIKGLPLLFEALAGLTTEFQGWSLVIAGGGEPGYATRLRECVRRLGLERAVHWAGPVHGQDHRDAYAAAELLVLPSHSENFGLVVAEALGVGVPVLTTRATPWSELAEIGCGWHVEATTAGIRGGLREALTSSAEELRAMGARGRRLVTERYTWSRTAASSVALYRWLLGRGPRPAFVLQGAVA
jgi:glycosyltransferase involved in cell wall biosynthesis